MHVEVQFDMVFERNVGAKIDSVVYVKGEVKK